MTPPLYDLVVIGGGSGGFNAARTAAGFGRKVAVVDGARELGGLCILRGCMPSKTLIYAAEVLHHARQGRRFGLRIPHAAPDPRAVRARKRKVIAEFAADRVKSLTSGRFELIRSRARFVDPHTVELDNGRRLRGRRFLIATGSRVSTPPVPGLAATPSWTSDQVLDLGFVPASVIVLGGGIVACELAQYLLRMGSKVTLIQRSPHVLREHSAEASEVVVRAFRDEGMKVYTGTLLRRISGGKSGVAVEFEHGGRKRTVRARHLFNALGREPNTEGLGLGAAGVKTDGKGRVRINRWQQTSQPHIYAAGDVCGPHEIVHLAVAQGELAARHAFRRKEAKPIDEKLLLTVVFTDPPLATIGLTEAALRREGTRHHAASYPFDDHGRSILMEAKYGFVKVLAEPKRGRILGAEIVGADAGELIHCFSGPLAMRATVFDLLRAPWYHPTLAEIITYPLEEIAEKIRGRAEPVGPHHA
ncbi:MAG TPA: NAD(P)/FAD-dependent oxidoreductase [Opitutaceae bacterium]|nr:NAD(P)/FAD-dependent oxidoreductase [Opitutaceae bacterium]